MQYGSAAGLRAGVRSGMGLTILPAFLADREPDLVRCIPPTADDTTGLWLLTHERLRPVPRVRTVLDFLARAQARLGRDWGLRFWADFYFPLFGANTNTPPLYE